jgi:putative endonuclease
MADTTPADLGRWGEKQAVRFLKRLGFKIIERNFVSPVGEIDVVAREGDVLVFVEVKTRTEADFGGPLPAVNASKRRKLVQVAKSYLAGRRALDVKCRFDVVGVVQKLGSDEPEIEHVRNAFSASGRPLGGE